ncbi:MAG: prenyltransferase [Actinobacteria bacterium]|nr:prenyltransferase [Actinomycetota bacterium]MBW3650964.1 prenyltransferase [Actinomycetota bacterium]
MSPLPDLPGVLSAEQVAATGAAIAAVQRPNGCIPWYDGGHADPWNHVEAAMALAVAGRRADSQRAFGWLEATQHVDGGWHTYYRGSQVEDARRDTNVSSYVAVGAWHHWLVTGDTGFIESLWPVVVGAVGFALRLQQPGGEILWSYERDGSPARYALLTGSSSVFLALRCALATAHLLGEERPEWELAASRLGSAIAHRSETAFEPKRRWAMDWYYPVLCGALCPSGGRARLAQRWEDFVLPGFGVRCVADEEWVTAAETAECVLALDAVGRREDARRLLTWVQYLREADGSYWTGCTHPSEVHFPPQERSTYTAAAMLLASDALGGITPAGGLFRGEGLPAVVVEPSMLTEPQAWLSEG